MEKTTFTARDISCEGCADSIKRTLSGVSGVSEVQVDVESKIVTVLHEPPADRQAIAARLDRAGFPVSD